MTTRPEEQTNDIHETVRAGYAKIARDAALSGSQSAGSCCGPGSSCGPAAASVDDFAASMGYSEAEVAALPEGTNMGLSCGNPTTLASLRPGDVVLDLGSGGGMDAFVAGPKVGASGRVIGVDMTAEMISKARKNALAYRQRTGLDNVEFRLGEIEHLPVADASVDVVISNCVLNLSPDKAQVWREIARVLKPGGRVSVSDLALEEPLPAAIVAQVEALIGCVAGAALVSETEQWARKAGLVAVEIRRKPEYVRAMISFEDPMYREIANHLPAGKTAADYITSLDVTAMKAKRV
jgi:SAM-dependent methyltransferase